jgi:16S rRNA processing protein RimM
LLKAGQNKPNLDNLIIMGRIVAPYGIYGWVKVQVSTQYIDSLADYDRWWIGREAGSPGQVIKTAPWQEYVLEQVKVHGDGLIAKLAGVDNRDQAFELRSRHVAVPRQALPEPDDGEYYWIDLIGLLVTNLQEKSLGIVTDIFETGANDVIVVKDAETGKERLIPFVGQAILDVNLKEKTLKVDWPIDWDE